MTVFRSFTRKPYGSIWIYRALRKTNLRMLHFSGDSDGVVPTLGTKTWIRKLNWPILKKWRAWYTNGQVSGFIQRYKLLDFVTVKGVGHMLGVTAIRRTMQAAMPHRTVRTQAHASAVPEQICCTEDRGPADTHAIVGNLVGNYNSYRGTVL